MTCGARQGAARPRDGAETGSGGSCSRSEDACSTPGQLENYYASGEVVRGEKSRDSLFGTPLGAYTQLALQEFRSSRVLLQGGLPEVLEVAANAAQSGIVTLAPYHR